MTPEQAIEIINQAINQGFKGGIYSLQDATFIVQALEILSPTKTVEEKIIK